LPIERLGEEVVRAQVERIVARGLSHVTGQNQYRQEAQLPSCISKPAEDFETVRLWHVEVEHDEVGLEFLEDPLCLRRVGHALNQCVVEGQEPPEHFDVVFAVVDDEHAVAQVLASSTWRTRARSVDSVNGLSSRATSGESVPVAPSAGCANPDM